MHCRSLLKPSSHLGKSTDSGITKSDRARPNSAKMTRYSNATKTCQRKIISLDDSDTSYHNLQPMGPRYRESFWAMRLPHSSSDILPFGPIEGLGHWLPLSTPCKTFMTMPCIKEVSGGCGSAGGGGGKAAQLRGCRLLLFDNNSKKCVCIVVEKK